MSAGQARATVDVADLAATPDVTVASDADGVSPGIDRRVAVTTLADFACRSGDLDPAGVIGPSARDGQRAHQRLQAQSEAESEVTLRRCVQIDDEWIELSGRIDLLDRGRGALGEIKSTLVPPERVPPARRALHRAQLMLYGWLWLGQSDVDAVTVLLEQVYVNLRTGLVSTESEPFTLAALDAQAVRALRTWVDWQRDIEVRRRCLCRTASTLAFPHTGFRSGQRSLSVAVYRALRDGASLMIEAPTGIGKTISALYPAVKALGEGHRHQIYYLTAKVSGRRSAIDAIQRLAEGGLAISGMTLRSRAASCFCERGKCERDDEGRCPMTLGFHDRLPSARRELVEAGVVSNELLDAIGWDHQLCPHALARQLIPWMDVIVGDYNHVFDPLARLPNVDESVPGSVLLIDEAHNLPDRARAMFSATLTRRECELAALTCRDSIPLLASRIERLDRSLRDVGRAAVDGLLDVDEPDPALMRVVHLVLESLTETLSDGGVLPEEALSLFRVLTRFSTVAALYGDDHRTLMEASRQGRRRAVSLQLVCLDAAPYLARQHGRHGAIVAFSATLSPTHFHRDALGLPTSTGALNLESPFDARNTLPCLVTWIDTRYRRRDASLSRLVNLIASVSDHRPGNYLVCLPSYAYLAQVHDAFCTAWPARETWRQVPGESNIAQDQRLQSLDTPGHRIGFAILGGVYAEGIDYVGERLIGVIIVGTGLSPPGVVPDLMIARHANRGRDGFDSVARYPGFTRVMQTAGRVVRREQDRGVIVLVDDRFAQPFYRRLYPAHWKLCEPVDENELGRRLQGFWSDTQGDDVGKPVSISNDAGPDAPPGYQSPLED